MPKPRQNICPNVTITTQIYYVKSQLAKFLEPPHLPTSDINLRVLILEWFVVIVYYEMLTLQIASPVL